MNHFVTSWFIPLIFFESIIYEESLCHPQIAKRAMSVDSSIQLFWIKVRAIRRTAGISLGFTKSYSVSFAKQKECPYDSMIMTENRRNVKSQYKKLL
ncbi:MAG: hypothetical protein C0403_14635 [Desulfobacterium sp.]|nr:hypothetical protein [Desulfobacterium sp.]